MKTLVLAAAFVVSISTASAQSRLQLIDPPSTHAAPQALEKSANAKVDRGHVRGRATQPNWQALNELRRQLRANPRQPVEIELPVFEDRSLVVAVDRLEQGEGVTRFYGTVPGDPLSSAVLVDAGGTFAMHVNQGDHSYQVTLRGNGHEVAEIDRKAFDKPDEPRVPRGSQRLGAKAAAEPIAATDDGSTIDVMVVYSDDVRVAAGGTAAIENQINLAIATTNQAYAASGVVQRVRLVHTVEVSYSEPGDMGITLDQITDGVAPFGGIAALRNQHGADLVSMWIENDPNYCGIGWLMDTVSSSFAPLGYHVVARDCATAGGTLTHEMGHNMGLEHDLFVSPEATHPVSQRYAHGYVNTTARFRTIMAYANACTSSGVTCTRINAMSSPLYNYNSVATGNATTADAARLLNLTRTTVANFRSGTVVTAPSTIGFVSAAYSVTEGGSVSPTVTRTGDTSTAASVTWTTANGTAVAGQDFGIAGSTAQRTGTLSWGAGESGTKAIPMPTIEDAIQEPNESFTIRLTNPTGAVLGARTTATVTIADNDSVFNFQAPTVSVNENGPNVVLRVTRTGATGATQNVTYATSNGSALAGTDFGIVGSALQRTGVLIFGAGVASRDIVIGSVAAAGAFIPVINDAVVEAAKSFNVTLSSPTAGGQLGSANTAVVTISSEDAPTAPGPSSVQFPSASMSVAEGTPNVTLSVQRTGSATDTASVTWSAANGTAIAGSDFGASGNATAPGGTLTWAAGDAAAKLITIPILNDAIAEGTKTFSVSLTNPVGSGVSIGPASSVNVSITDTDSGAMLGAAAYTVAENARSLSISVRRTGSATAAASVQWTTANGSAAAGQDFGIVGSTIQRSGTISWGAGDAAIKTIVIPILNDTVSEGSETFTVSLRTPVGVALGSPATTTVTITDDDQPVAAELRFDQPKYHVIENAVEARIGVLRVDLGGGVNTTATVSYSTQAGTALATSDFTSRTGTLTWAPGDTSAKTITIPIVDNAMAEPPETFKVVLSGASGGTGIATPEVTVVILDDDEVFPPDGAIPSLWTVPAGVSAGWHVSNDPGPYEGAFSLRSDSIDDAESAGIQVSGTFAAGTITFRVKVSSEPGFDALRFYVDGVEMGEWSGTAVPGWQAFSMPLAAGAHTLRWTFEKDGSVSIGQDAAWLDGVVLPAVSP